MWQPGQVNQSLLSCAKSEAWTGALNTARALSSPALPFHGSSFLRLPVLTRNLHMAKRYFKIIVLVIPSISGFYFLEFIKITPGP